MTYAIPVRPNKGSHTCQKGLDQKGFVSLYTLDHAELH